MDAGSRMRSVSAAYSGSRNRCTAVSSTTAVARRVMHAIAPAWPTGIACRWSPTIAIPAPVSSARVASAFAVCRSTMPASSTTIRSPARSANRRGPVVDATSARVDLPAREARPHLGAGVVPAPPPAVVGEQRVQARRGRADLATRDRRRLLRRRDDHHPPPLPCQRASRDTQHRGLARARRTGDRDEPVGPGDRRRGIRLALVEREAVGQHLGTDPRDLGSRRQGRPARVSASKRAASSTFSAAVEAAMNALTCAGRFARPRGGRR